MNGRIEREHAEVISITSGRDGGASLTELRDRRQDARPRMYETWQEVAWRLGSVLAAWTLFCWFVSILVRGRGAAGWEPGAAAGGLAMCGHGSVYRRQEVSEAERINCPKCGTVHDNPRYHDSNWGECGNVECGFNDFSKTSGEHLHRYCKCGYDWTEPIILLREAGIEGKSNGCSANPRKGKY